MTAPSSRETPPAASERTPARKRVSARDLFTPHDFGPWPEDGEKALSREEIYSDERP